MRLPARVPPQLPFYVGADIIQYLRVHVLTMASQAPLRQSSRRRALHLLLILTLFSRARGYSLHAVQHALQGPGNQVLMPLEYVGVSVRGTRVSASVPTPSLHVCQDRCLRTPHCEHVIYQGGTCHLAKDMFRGSDRFAQGEVPGATFAIPRPNNDAYHCVPDYDVSGDAYDVLDLSTGAAMPVPTEDGIATCRNACEAAGDDCHFFVWWGERSACFLRHEPLKGTTSRSKTGPVGKKQGLVTCLRAYTHGHQPPPAPSSAPLEDSLDYHGVAVRSMVLQTIYSVQRAEECKERCKQSPSCEHVVYQARVCYLCAKMFKGDSFFNGASEWFTLAVVRPNNGNFRCVEGVYDARSTADGELRQVKLASDGGLTTEQQVSRCADLCHQAGRQCQVAIHSHQDDTCRLHGSLRKVAAGIKRLEVGQGSSAGGPDRQLATTCIRASLAD